MLAWTVYLAFLGVTALRRLPRGIALESTPELTLNL